MKTTLVLGASENPERYSNKAIRMLRKYKFPVKAIGKKIGRVEDIDIESEKKEYEDIDTVTMYLGEKHQAEYYDYLLTLKPRRIIFNPGAENEELADIAKTNGIEVLEACTLVLLSTGQYDKVPY